MKYESFVAQKLTRAPATGLTTVPPLSDALFGFQRDIVRWAMKRGRAAVFADTGLGKTRMQLEWARHVGDVLVLASGDHQGCALVGDHMGRLLHNAGAAGIVTDGRVRDLEGLREIGMPVYARGTSPRAPRKAGPGTVGLPVTLGGVAVHAGDFVIADEDGVVVLPRDGFDSIAARLDAVCAREAQTDARARAGATAPPDFQALLDRAGVRWLP